MEPESIKDDRGERQRQVSDAPAETGGSPTMRAGMLSNWREAKGDEAGEKPASEANPEPPSNETDGTQQRGMLDDFWRGEPDNAKQANDDVASTTDESNEPKTGDAGTQKEKPTLRDGKPRD